MGKIVCIGGGELRNKTTLPIDRYIRNLVDKQKPYALFVPTASHDSKPYFNTFRKTYTSELNCKSDVALLTTGEMSMEKIEEKIFAADIIYVGGGDTEYMLSIWRLTGFDKMLLGAYKRGVVIAGLSAGAIFWFDAFLSSTLKDKDPSKPYVVINGLNFIHAFVTPHLQNSEIEAAFIKEIKKEKYPLNIGIENDCALIYDDFNLQEVISCNGKAFTYKFENNELKKVEICQNFKIVK